MLDSAVEDVLGVRLSNVFFLWCDTGIRITEIKQTLTLETIGVMIETATSGAMHACKSAPGVGGFSSSESEASANDESGG